MFMADKYRPRKGQEAPVKPDSAERGNPAKIVLV